jgi:hypothetical protein
MASPDASVGGPTAKIGRPGPVVGKATGLGLFITTAKEPRLSRGLVVQRRTDLARIGAGSDNYNARFRRSRHEDLGRPLSWLRANVLQYLFAERIRVRQPWQAQ